MLGPRPETVTVLFSDVVASTPWRTELGEAVADVRMAELSASSREIVDVHGGTVVKGLGDGVMATFTSAAAAVDAAAALQVVADRLSVGDDGPGLRIGISSGDMVPDGEDWSGAAAIEASRLCTECAGGTTLVAGASVQLSKGRTSHRLRQVGERVLRGFVDPIDVYELVLPRRAPPVPEPLVRAAEAQLAGRRNELDRVATLLEGLSAGSATSLLLVGEPGVGKTRLAAEIAMEAARRGCTVLHGRCNEGLAAPHQPIVDAFGPWLEERPAAALRRLIGAGAPELARLWPHLGAWLGEPPGGAGLDPEVQRWRLFEAMAGVLRSVAMDRPAVVIVDDLQWAEPSTLLLLRYLIRQEVPRSMVLGITRPEELGAEIGEVERWALDGLDAGAVVELVELQGAARPPMPVAEDLRRRTAGNPFFLLALIADLAEAAALQQPDGTWASSRALDDVGVPSRVRDVILRRVSRLTPPTRRIVGAGAIVGLEFDERIVRGVLDVGTDLTLDALDEAQAAGLVAELDAGRWTFVHALARDAVLGELSRTRASELHWRVGEQLERDSTSARWAEISGHYILGADAGDPATIVRSARRAGDEALEGAAFEDAVEHFQTALTALDRLPDDPDLRFHLLVSQGLALNALSSPDIAEQRWLEAADIARAGRDPERMFAAIRGYGYVFRLRTDVELVDLLNEVLELVGPGDSALRAAALGWRAVPWIRGDMVRPPASDAGEVEAAVAMARRVGDPFALASTLRSRLTMNGGGPDAVSMLRDAEELVVLRRDGGNANFGDDAAEWRDMTRAMLRLGDRRAAEEHLAIASDRAKRSGTMARCVAVMLESAIAAASGRFSDAKRLSAEGAAVGGRNIALVELGYTAQILAVRMEEGRSSEVVSTLRALDGLPVDLRAWQGMLVGALVECGERTEALARFKGLIAGPDLSIPRDYGAPLAIRYLAEACLSFGDATHAAALLPMVQPWAGQLLVVTAGTSIEGAADRSIGHLLAALGRTDEAVDAYSAAARLERNAEFPPLVARTELWHARALLARGARGDEHRAGDLLEHSLDCATRLGMRGVEAQARAMLAR